MAEQTRYVCEVTGKTYKTKRGARNSEIRESVKLRQRNYARENASTLEELVNIIVQKSKEFYGWDVVIHSVLDIKVVVERKTNNLGIRFELSFNLDAKKKVGQYRYITDFLCDGFSGLQQYWKNWANFRTQNVSGKPVNADMFISFSDFPRIHEKYKEYISLREAKDSYFRKEQGVKREAEVFTRLLPEYLNQKRLVSDMYKSLEVQRELLGKIENYNLQGYLSLWRRSEGPAPEIPVELYTMFGDHC